VGGHSTLASQWPSHASVRRTGHSQFHTELRSLVVHNYKCWRRVSELASLEAVALVVRMCSWSLVGFKVCAFDGGDGRVGIDLMYVPPTGTGSTVPPFTGGMGPGGDGSDGGSAAYLNEVGAESTLSLIEASGMPCTPSETRPQLDIPRLGCIQYSGSILSTNTQEFFGVPHLPAPKVEHVNAHGMSAFSFALCMMLCLMMVQIKKRRQ
jgi:hypothetical protein